MAKEEIHNGLAELQEKLKRLLDKHSALQRENRKLTTGNENLQQQVAAKDAQIKSLQQQVAVVKSGIKSWHPEQKKLFVKRIDAYLKEHGFPFALVKAQSLPGTLTGASQGTINQSCGR